MMSAQEKNTKASIDKVADQLKTQNRLLGNEEAFLVTNLELTKSYVNQILGQILGSSSPACAITYKLDADGELTLISVSYVHLDKQLCILFDIKSICQNSRRSMDVLKPLLESDHLKMCPDVKDFGTILKSQFNITLSNVIDTQLVFECLTGKIQGSIKDFVHWCDLDTNPIRLSDCNLWGNRPLSHPQKNFASYEVHRLFYAIFSSKCYNMLTTHLSVFMKASRTLCTMDPLECSGHQFGFGSLPGLAGESIHSLQLLRCFNPMENDMSSWVEVEDNVYDLLEYIPEQFHVFFDSDFITELRDMIFEVGARPYAYYGHRKRVFLSDDPSVVMSAHQMKDMADKFKNRFSSNNRAGIDRSLNRISAMRSNCGQIYSLTFRVGRAVRGNAFMLKDLLMDESLSVLVMGIPGSGKTTLIRDIAKLLSEEAYNVVIVDTSNELAGDGMIPHPSVGMARRIMVPHLKRQPDKLIEAVQNHTPDVIICDEIGRGQEVQAMQTIKERGVRCIASAHGCLRGLVKNRQLNGLVGGVENVTIGDMEAANLQRSMGGEFSKVRQQRSGTPVFDVILELKPNQMDEWTVIKDVDKAVDKILAGKKYGAQVRRRNSTTGVMTVEIVQN